jgi:hypothetical protein
MAHIKINTLPVTLAKATVQGSRYGLGPWIPAFRGNDDVEF